MDLDQPTPFGSMIALAHLRSFLDRLFCRAQAQSFAAFSAMAFGVRRSGGASFPGSPAARLVSPQIFFVLVLAAGANCIIQSLATLLRSFKKGTIPHSVADCVLAHFVAGRASLPAAGVAQARPSAIFPRRRASRGPSALAIFARARRNYLARNLRTSPRFLIEFQPQESTINFCSRYRKAAYTFAPPLGRSYRVLRDATSRRRAESRRPTASPWPAIRKLRLRAGKATKSRPFFPCSKTTMWLSTSEPTSVSISLSWPPAAEKRQWPSSRFPANLHYLYRNLWAQPASRCRSVSHGPGARAWAQAHLRLWRHCLFSPRVGSGARRAIYARTANVPRRSREWPIRHEEVAHQAGRRGIRA